MKRPSAKEVGQGVLIAFLIALFVLLFGVSLLDMYLHPMP